MPDATDVKVMTLDAYQAGTEAIVDNLIPTDVSTTLVATNWVTTTSGGKTIHTYPLSISIAGKYRTVICSLSPNATVAQSSTMVNAKIESISYDSENEVLSIVAAGIKPAADIPVVIQLATVNSVAEAPKYVEGANVPIASTAVLGIVRIDGTSITIDQNGVISADSGHTIVNEEDTSMTKRSNLQFIGGVTVTDDSTNDATVVNIEGEQIQVDSLPTASADELGNVYQYLGADTQDYTHGYFYECTLNNSVYSWTTIGVDSALVEHEESEVLSTDGVHGIKSVKTGNAYNIQVNDNGTWHNAGVQQTDIASIVTTGTTNTTGSTIAAGTYFYLNGALNKAKANIAANAQYTASNCEVVTVGAELTALNGGPVAIDITSKITYSTGASDVYGRTFAKMIGNMVILDLFVWYQFTLNTTINPLITFSSDIVSIVSARATGLLIHSVNGQQIGTCEMDIPLNGRTITIQPYASASGSDSAIMGQIIFFI